MTGLWKRTGTWVRDCLRVQFKTERVEEDPPERPRAHTFYIVTEDGQPWSAAMICPCGCGEMLHMNLLPDERPVWALTMHNGSVSSLHPSVHRQKGCKAHFWFRSGRVYWCSDQDGPLKRDLRLLLISPLREFLRHRRR
jgi:hypothetical protein